MQMSDIELHHANAFLHRYQLQNPDYPLPSASFQARTLNAIGKIFGYNYVLGVLLDKEKSLYESMVQLKLKNQLPQDVNDKNHVRILRTLMENHPQIPAENMENGQLKILDFKF